MKITLNTVSLRSQIYIFGLKNHPDFLSHKCVILVFPAKDLSRRTFSPIRAIPEHRLQPPGGTNSRKPSKTFAPSIRAFTFQFLGELYLHQLSTHHGVDKHHCRPDIISHWLPRRIHRRYRNLPIVLQPTCDISGS
jgi:hypothetical protein